MPEENIIRVGSRKSQLALIQTHHVISELEKIHPEKKFEVVKMSTLGDRILDIPLPKIGEKSLFTKELETALATGEVDFIVHSLKDLPTSLPTGMAIGAVLLREDPRDALVVQKNLTSSSLNDLPANSVIGTSSLRRTAQLAKNFPHLKIESIRGNLNTRLKKLDELGKFHAIILAAAGLIRIGWKDRISTLLETNDLLYAVGQGALAIECRQNDDKIIDLLEPLYDARTALQVIAERSFLSTLGGGCSAPVAVCCDLNRVEDSNFEVKLEGAVWSLDGQEEIKDTDSVKLKVINGMRCAMCPNNNLKNKTNGFDDIESFKECSNCLNTEGPTPAKKIKLDVSNEVLGDDPHEKCPVEVPVGADFMGQCPYLEGDLEALKKIKLPIEDIVTKCPYMRENVFENPVVDNGIQNNPSTSSVSIEESEKQDKKLDTLAKCPYVKKDILNKEINGNGVQNIASTSSISEEESDKQLGKLFAGLVPHKKISNENLEKVRDLGQKLAEKLMGRGATKVMAAAQAIVHGQMNSVST